MKKEITFSAAAATNAVTATTIAPATTAKEAVKKTAEKKSAPKAATKAEELQAEIAKKTAELQKTLQVLEKKQKLNSLRTLFLETLDKVNQFGEELASSEDDFEEGKMKLTFVGNSYSSRPDFSVSSTPILKEFITFIREKIETKIKNLEAELIK